MFTLCKYQLHWKGIFLISTNFKSIIYISNFQDFEKLIRFYFTLTLQRNYRYDLSYILR